MDQPTEKNTPHVAHYGLGKIWHEGDLLAKFSNKEQIGQLFVEAGRSIKASPVTTVVTALTMAVTLFIFSLFILFLENLGNILSATKTEVSLSLYLRDGVSAQEAGQLQAEVSKQASVAKIEYRSKDDALKVFRESLGKETGILEGLADNNPLPASLEIRLKDQYGDKNVFEKLSGDFVSHKFVEHVQYNRGLIGQVTDLLKVVRAGGAFATGLMLLMTGFIIASTLKLALYSRRDEIEIMQLVGGTAASVRVPCMIEAGAQGLLAGILSLLAAYPFFRLFANTLASSDTLRLILPSLQFLSWPSILMVILTGVLVGLAGAYFAVRPFIND